MKRNAESGCGIKGIDVVIQGGENAAANSIEEKGSFLGGK